MKVVEKLKQFVLSIKEFAPKYSIELFLFASVFVVSILRDSPTYSGDSLELYMLSVPAALVFTFIVNLNCKRWLYYPLSLVVILTTVWLYQKGYIVANLHSYLPLVALLVTTAKTKNNKLFTQRIIGGLSALASSIALALVVLGILLGTLYSIENLFGLTQIIDSDVYDYTSRFVGTIIAPLLLFHFVDNYRRYQDDNSNYGTSYDNLLLNYILSPSILLYSVILYVYTFIILFNWELPVGNIGYMVSSFVAVYMVGRVLDAQSDSRSFAWLYRAMGWVLLAPIAMYWVGSIRRIIDYGFTPARVYLVALGIIMTCTALFFIFRRTARYIYIATLYTLLTLVLGYVPALSPDAISIRSQHKRIVDGAAELNILTSDGTLAKGGNFGSDSLVVTRLLGMESSYDFISSRIKPRAHRHSYVNNLASSYIGKLGVNYFSDIYALGYSPSVLGHSDSKYIYFSYGNHTISVEGYSHLILDVNTYSDAPIYKYSPSNGLLQIALSGQAPITIDLVAKLSSGVAKLASNRDLNKAKFMEHGLNFVQSNSVCIYFDHIDFSIKNGELESISDIGIYAILY